MITKFKDFLNENQQVDKILDKISKSGINSLTKQEKEYLDRYSTGEELPEEITKESELKGKKFVSDQMNIPEMVFVYDMTKDLGDEIRHYGDMTFGDTTFNGFISCTRDGDFKHAEFYDVDEFDDYTRDITTDLYTKAEGLEHEIDSFFIDEVCPYLI